MSVSDFGAWYGVQSPTTLPAFLLKASGTFQSGSFSDPQSVTLPSSYSTATNDCIVVALCTQGSTTPTFSGSGATWVTVVPGTLPETVLAIGYACTSGQTAFQFTGQSGNVGDLIIGVFSGVKFSSSPVAGSQTQTATTASTITTPSESYTTTELVVSMAGAGSGTAFNAPTFGNGLSSSLIGTSNTNRGVRADYQIPASGSATTATYTITGSQTLRAAIVALDHS